MAGGGKADSRADWSVAAPQGMSHIRLPLHSVAVWPAEPGKQLLLAGPALRFSIDWALRSMDRYTYGSPIRYPEPSPMIFSRDYIGYLARRTVKHLIDAKLITTSDLKVTEERVNAALLEELSFEDRINEEVRVILDAYSDEMRKSGAQYAEMFKKVKNELAKKYKAVL